MSNTTANLSDTGTIEKGTGSFMWARLASLVSILPLGVWTVWHLWENLTAFQGAEVWESTVTRYRHPYSFVFTLVMVFLPLAIHTIWGIQRVMSSRPNNGHYKYFGNLKYLVHRIAAVGVLGFLGAHIWLAFLRPRFVLGHPEVFSDISAFMHHHPQTLAVYLLGTLGVSYHLANGISTFAWQWGGVSGRRSYRRFELLSWVIFGILLAMSWGVIFAMYNAGADYPLPE